MRRLISLIVLALFGPIACEDPTPSRVDAGPIGDASRDAHTLSDGGVIDGALSDAAPPDQGAGPPGPLCPPPPIRLYDRLVRATATGVDVGEAPYALPRGARLIGISAATERPVGSAQILLTLATADGCALHALDEAGTLRWQIAAPPCQPARVGDGNALLPITDAEGGAVLLVDLDAGAVARRIALPAPPTTSAAFSGLDASGGSHWYVGAGRQVARLTPADDWRVAAQAVDVDVRALAVAGPELGVIVGDLAGADPVGLGAHVQRVRLDGPTPIDPSAPLALPGPAHAAPIALPPCPKLEASGGSHWWCDEGVFALAGDGWLRGWSLLGEGLALSVDVDPGLRLTGLAAGRDGLIYSGGSHWLEGGWTLLAAGLGGPVELLRGDGPGCLPSPLLDTDGQLRTQAGAAPIDHPTTAGGLPRGWARAGGDAAGSGRPGARGCEGGSSVLYTRRYPAGAIRVTAATVIDGHVFVAGVRGIGEAARTWAGRVAPDGVLEWAVEFAPQGDVDPETQPPLVIGERIGMLTIVQASDNFLVTSRIDFDGTNAGTARVDQQAFERRLTAAAPGPPDIVLAGVYEGAEIGADQVWLLPYTDGILDVEIPVRDPLRLTPRRVARLDGGWLLATDTDTGVVLKAVDAAGADRWRVVIAAPLDARLTVAGVGLTADERIALLMHEAGVTDRARLALFDTAGEALGESALDAANPIDLALRPDGSGLIVLADLRLAQVTPQGGIAPASDPIAVGGASLTVTHGGGAVVLGQAPNGQLLAARTSPEGYASCAAAGRCVERPGCPFDDACAAAICRPTDGLCDAIPLADEMLCGASMTCEAGACMP